MQDVVINGRFEASVVDEIDLATEDQFEQLPETNEPERRCLRGSFDDEVDVGIGSRLMTRKRRAFGV